MKCVWEISSSIKTARISISFDYFHTECFYDYLSILDGSYYNESTPIAAKFCGNRYNDAPFVSSGNALTIMFVSDNLVNNLGFSANFSVLMEKKVCKTDTDCYGSQCINSECNCDNTHNGLLCEKGNFSIICRN
jgi:hypothetical protein